MNPRNQFYGQNYGRRPYPHQQNGNRNLGPFLVGGALGYGLGFFTPRQTGPVFYPIYPVGPFGPNPYYRPYFW